MDMTAVPESLAYRIDEPDQLIDVNNVESPMTDQSETGVSVEEETNSETAMDVDVDLSQSANTYRVDDDGVLENTNQMESMNPEEPGPSTSMSKSQFVHKRVRPMRSVSPTPGIKTMLSIGNSYMSLGGRMIQTAVPRGKRRTSTSEPKSPAIQSKCINEHCLSMSPDLELVKAPSQAVIYYGCASSAQEGQPPPKPQRYKICPDCLEHANDYWENTKKAYEAETPVLEVPICSTAEPGGRVVETSDPESDTDVIEDIELDDDIPEDVGVDQILEEMLTSLRMNSQVTSCLEYLEKEIDELESGFEAVNEAFEEASVNIDAIHADYQTMCGPTHNSIILKSVEVDSSTGKVSTINSTDVETQEYLAAQARLNPGVTTEVKKEVSNEAQACQNDIQAVKIKKSKNPLAGTPTVIPRMMPKVGDTVYGMKHSALSYWIPGQVSEIFRNSLTRQIEYKVQFEITRKGRPYTGSGPGRDVTYQFKNMSAKLLAYNIPCPFILPVGTRVISRFRDEFKTEPLGNNNFYVGIVAEPPKNTNSHRYLIFFDDGYAQYANPKDVLLVCESSPEVWYDVHPDSQEFIKNYIIKYPERPMVRLQKGTLMSTEWNGNWWIARIIEVDCSLVKIYFEEDGRFEWIYRGSTRLAPLYTKARGLEGVPVSKVPRRQNRTFNPKSKTQAVIEYTYVDSQDPAPVSKGTARKSTAQPPPPVPEVVTSSVTKRQVLKPQGSRGVGDLVEYEGSTTKITITDVDGPTSFKPHECKSSCVRPFTESDPQIRLINPLSLPLYLGWAREIGKTPRRTIFYRAPCGRRLRSYDELHEFLKQTKYNMGMDYFCFDFAVDCLSEFVATRQHYLLQDISYGKEVVPVQCVNSVDHDYPEHVDYAMNRMIGQGVPCNLDQGFLTCCDCEDDCSDKEKCSCWQLTIEGTNLGKDTINLEVGYQNRRLMDHVISGIYECNPGCKCRSTCSNRVVQNNLKWQLQLFKTVSKGWAIRPLYDIPQGAFICVYAGQLLTEHGADKDGKAYGDEYLAELDYIEVIESVKEGYEAEAIEDDRDREAAVQSAQKHRYKAYMDDEQNGALKVSDFAVFPGQKQTTARTKEKATGSNDNPLDSDSDDDDEAPAKSSTRSLFGPNELCYIMDAKSIGNVGRYLNHSCTPNVFVQNVFVDTHDIRFPWVAFFAYKHIRAGTELTWDYNYDVGSVPGKVMYCHCSSPDCRGRLL